MNVFRLTDCNEENEGKSFKGVGFENGISIKELVTHFVLFLDHKVFVEEINQVREGEQASSSCKDDDSSRLGDL